MLAAVDSPAMDGNRLRRWERISQLAVDSDEIRELRAAIAEVCEKPADVSRRQHLHVLAQARALSDQLPPLLIAETHAQQHSGVVAVLREETAKAFAAIGEAQGELARGDDADVIEARAFSRYLTGDWLGAARELEKLAAHVEGEQWLV